MGCTPKGGFTAGWDSYTAETGVGAEPPSPTVMPASVAIRLVISEGSAMRRFSVTVPRLDNQSSGWMGIGPSEAVCTIVHG